MFIGKKNNHIVVFNESRDDLAINAAIKGITLDFIEETEEQIVLSHNTQNDGIYYKLSEVPEEPSIVSMLSSKLAARNNTPLSPIPSSATSQSSEIEWQTASTPLPGGKNFLGKHHR
jgi:hypothetical protein